MEGGESQYTLLVPHRSASIVPANRSQAACLKQKECDTQIGFPQSKSGFDEISLVERIQHADPASNNPQRSRVSSTSVKLNPIKKIYKASVAGHHGDYVNVSNATSAPMWPRCPDI